MRLRARQVESLIESASTPRPQTIHDAEEHFRNAATPTDAFIASLIQNKSTSSPKAGELLPMGHRSSPEDELGNENENESELESQPTNLITTLPPTALLGVDLHNITSRADLIKALTSRLPINEFGLPRIIYRTDLLDPRIFQDKGYPEGHYLLAAQYREMQDYLDAATVYLDYTEGFPALPSGEALWQKLPTEAPERYAAFTEYCCQPGSRSLNTIAAYPLQMLLEWFHEDYWSLRAKTYDLHHAVHQAKLREQRILGSEDKHYKLADQLVQKLTHVLDTVQWENLASEPDKFLKTMQLAVNLQRQSLGLSSATSTSGKGEGGAGGQVRNESIELIMRKATAPEVKMLRDQRNNIEGDQGVSIRSLLKDSDALASAQELIVRMSNTTIVNAPPLPEDLEQGE